MILILTRSDNDPTVTRVQRMLEDSGADTIVLSAATLETPSALEISGRDGRGECLLRLPERLIRLRDVRAAWLWRSWRPEPLLPRFEAAARDRQAWSFFEREWVAFHKGVSMALGAHDVFCVNPPPWNTAYEEKCAQLLLAAELGLVVPPTLYTTRLGVAHEFMNAHGSLIYKPFRSYFQVEQPDADGQARYRQLYSNRVAAEHLVEHPGMLPTPGIFQPYIAKQFEVRVTVVGRRLFACAIHSQRSERSREDWRRYDLEHTPYEPYELPSDVAGRLLRLMQRLNLLFGCIDLIVTPDGEHVFLEVNPNGQFDWVAQRAGLPIYEHLTAMLRAASVEYSVVEVQHAP